MTWLRINANQSYNMCDGTFIAIVNMCILVKYHLLMTSETLGVKTLTSTEVFENNGCFVNRGVFYHTPHAVFMPLSPV